MTGEYVRPELTKAGFVRSTPTECPECAAGKCGACNGDAWCFATDLPTACSCWARDHKDAA